MKQLKIVEQIIIVLVLAVLIPFITIGIIISNISQQSVRNELVSNTDIIAQYVATSIDNYIKISQSQLNQAADGFKYVENGLDKVKYFNEIETKSHLLKELKLVSYKDVPKRKYTTNNDDLILTSQIDKDKNYYLTATLNLNIIDKILKKYANERNIFVIDCDLKKLVITNNKDASIDDAIKDFDFNSKEESGQFGQKKNTPKVFYRLDNPNWVVIVDTTKKVTKKTINKARYRIILALSIAALSIIVIVSLYTSYLYINIRQLLRGITAISKGNYDKKIHLVKTIFTPYETIFLAKEFNYMANKIKLSYKDLKEKNKKLQELGEFRENLISATSHEFRTPLTSIIGYTSRLLRHDIVLDEETKVKSLKIVKQQAQRLSEMVEDLLVIPELDSFSLKFNMQEADLIDTILRTCEYLKDKDVEYVLDLDKTLPYVWADESRLEQIMVNLIGNAIKYSLDKKPIKIVAKMEENKPVVYVINECEKISKEDKEKLFEKFTRIDSKLTRTTRGTGLGLYIVKGLCEGMKIDISLEADDEFKIKLKFNELC